jgi:thiol:disulfide interchange protein DsbD
MEIVKEAMAFPLFATVVWLTRVFARQMGLEAHGLDLLTNLLCGLLAGALGFWLLLRARSITSKRGKLIAKLIAAIAFIAALVVGFPSSAEIEGARSRSCLANEGGSPEPDEYGLIWEPYSEQRLSALMREGRSIYLDFTAEWCITCQVNKRIVFSSSEVRAMIVQKNIALVRGDWTSKSPSVTAALRRYGRNGVPLNIIVPHGREGDSVVLPSLLTPGVVLGEMGKL